MLFNDEQIRAAAHTDIRKYCKARGLPLTRESGDVYRFLNHTLQITGSTWEENGSKPDGEKHKSGNAIKFVQEYEGLSFRSAVISLLAFTASPLLKDKPSVRVKLETYTNEARSKPQPPSPPHKEYAGTQVAQKLPAQGAPPQEYIAEIDGNPDFERVRTPKGCIIPQGASTNKNVIAYLNQIRGIDYEIINEMIRRKLLYEDTRKNCVFVGYDRKNVVKHISLEPIGNKKKHDITDHAPHNKKLYGWSVTPDRRSPLLRVFKSAVDALSFMTIEKMAGNDWSNAHYLAIGSLAPGPIIHFLRMFQEIEVVELCFDNDPASHRFIREFTGHFTDKSITWKPRTANAGNWSEQLRHILSPAKTPKGDD